MNYDVLVVIVVLNAVVTVSLWRSTALLWRRASLKPPNLKKKYAKSFWKSGPINPTHEPPRPTDFPYHAYRRFFYDFADFADVLNGWLANRYHKSRWRLQDLPETDVSRSQDGPVFGRAYAVFYNQERIGKIRMNGGFDYASPSALRQQDRLPRDSIVQSFSSKVHTHIELRWVRLLGYDAIEDFLTCIAEAVTDYNPKSDEFFPARQSIQFAMLKVLWEYHRVTEFEDLDSHEEWGELSLSFHGTPSSYFHVTDRRSERKRAASSA
jgi:hypothetical protein